MIADIRIIEKSIGAKKLMHDIKFSIAEGEKVGLVGRNGVGKSTLFGILAGLDTDYSGEVIFRRGVSVVSTSQEHGNVGSKNVLQYVLEGLPEYAELSRIIETYPQTMGSDMRKIERYTSALQRFDDKGFYQIEELIERELANFQLPPDCARRAFSTLSGGQKRLVEVVKIMHSQAHLALVDEPTNHMDYVAKAQFIDWFKKAREAILVITHDRDVLVQVDRIIELKDGQSFSFNGNYDAYLKQNAVATGTQMNEFELVEKRISNLKQKAIDYQRLKEKSRNPGTIQNFKRLEEDARRELAELEKKQKPTFWIDKESAGQLNYKTASQYEKFKAKNLCINLKEDESRSKRTLVAVRDLALGYGDNLLFEAIDFDLCEGEAVELRGRNGAGKTTLIKYLLAQHAEKSGDMTVFDGELKLDANIRIGIYEQEVSPRYFDLTLKDAIEKTYLQRNLPISETKIRQLLADYLFSESDTATLVKNLSGGQKARLQLISMLANDPQLLILDEPTNHLDLPSIEELESALARYGGAVLYVSHDDYFRKALSGRVVQVGAV